MAKNKKQNVLFNFYGAKISKNEKYVNVTLINDDSDERKYVNATVKINSDKKISAKVKDNFAYIKLPLYVDKKEKSDDTFQVFDGD